MPNRPDLMALHHALLDRSPPLVQSADDGVCCKIIWTLIRITKLIINHKWRIWSCYIYLAKSNTSNYYV